MFDCLPAGYCCGTVLLFHSAQYVEQYCPSARGRTPTAGRTDCGVATRGVRPETAWTSLRTFAGTIGVLVAVSARTPWLVSVRSPTPNAAPVARAVPVRV